MALPITVHCQEATPDFKYMCHQRLEYLTRHLKLLAFFPWREKKLVFRGFLFSPDFCVWSCHRGPSPSTRLLRLQPRLQGLQRRLRSAGRSSRSSTGPRRVHTAPCQLRRRGPQTLRQPWAGSCTPRREQSDGDAGMGLRGNPSWEDVPILSLVSLGSRGQE